MPGIKFLSLIELVISLELVLLVISLVHSFELWFGLSFVFKNSVNDRLKIKMISSKF